MMRVKSGDEIEKYVLLSNSHNGQNSLRVLLTPVRVVCNNTLTRATRYRGGIRVPHRKGLTERLDQAAENLGLLHREFAALESVLNSMATVRMDRGRLNEYWHEVFPMPAAIKADREREAVQLSREWAEHFYKDGVGNRSEEISGTLYAAYNGVTELVDHRGGQFSAESRLRSIWFGTGLELKARAMRIAEEKLHCWA